MTITSEHTAAPPTFNSVTDVLVIGGGLGGCWAAVSAAREGARVLKTALGYLSGNYLIAARHAALEDPLRVQVIQDYLPHQAHTLEWINNNPEPWAPETARLLRGRQSCFLDMYNSRSHPSRIIEVNNQAIASRQEVTDLFVDAGVLCERLEVSPQWDKNFRLLPL